jgi:hypothetical protein
MKAFYEDPFFNDQFESSIFDEFDDYMRQIRNHFNNLFNSAFQIKPVKTKQISDSKNIESKSTSNPENSKNTSSPEISQMESNLTKGDNPKNYVYSSKFSSYSDGNGVTHTKYKVSDSIHGTKMAETRRIGDRAITWKRVINKEGSIEDKETIHNIKEKDKFTQEWEERSQKCFGISGNRNISHSDQGAIQ